MYDAMRFWLDRGVDGFRVDVLWLLIKDDQFRDNPPNPAWTPTQPVINRYLSLYNGDRPENLEIVEQMRAVLDRYSDRVLIGEIYLPFDRLAAYYGKDLSGAQLPFNFALIHADLECGQHCFPDRGVREVVARRAVGRTGFLAITISLALRRGSELRKPASRRCCC